MSPARKPTHASRSPRIERSFPRFTLSQRWEHALVILSFLTLLATGLPQKYRLTEWSQTILSTPERLATLRQVHHIAAIVLGIVVVYHLAKAIVLMTQRRLPGDIFPVWQDVKDAGGMLKYLLFLAREKPRYGKYNFEQKITYWFFFFGIGILGISGLITWFPGWFTRFLPGGVIPAAKLAHSNEAIVAAAFLFIWHIYHVLLERLNLSMFTGRLSEHEMREFHTAEYERLTGKKVSAPQGGSKR